MKFAESIKMKSKTTTSFKVGAAFEAIEAERKALGVSDYSVAQPTLEQVHPLTLSLI